MRNSLYYKNWNYNNDYARIKRIKVVLLILFALFIYSFIVNYQWYFSLVTTLFINLVNLLAINFSPILIDGSTNANFIPQTALAKLIVCVLIAIGLYFIFRGKIARFKMRMLTFTKNTYSKGKSMFMNRKEEKQAFLEVAEGNELFCGTLISQFISIRFLGIELKKVPHFIFDNNLYQKRSESYIVENGISYTKVETNELTTKFMKTARAYDRLRKLDYRLNILEYRNTYQLLTEPFHYLVIGTTRSWKTQTFSIPQIKYCADIKKYEEKPNLVITDPKGELHRTTKELLESGEYTTLVINLVEPEFSAQFNPFEEVMDLYIKACVDSGIDVNQKIEEIDEFRFLHQKINTTACEDEVLKIANTLYPLDTVGENAIFTKLANSLFLAVVFLHLEKCVFRKEFDNFTINGILTTSWSLFQIDKSKKPVIAQVVQKLESSHAAKRFYSSSLSDRTFNSVVTTFENELKVYATKTMQATTEKSTIEMSDFSAGDKPIALFFITPDYDSKYNSLITMFINQLYVHCATQADLNGGRLKRRLMFLLDEFGNIPKIDNMDTKATVALGRGISFAILIQNLSQLTAVYGEQVAKTILDNVQAKLYLLAGDSDTREWFSKELGNTTQVSASYSGREYSELSKTVSEEEIALVPPEMLAKTRPGEGYLTLLRHNPCKVSLRPAFSYINNEEEK